MQSPQMWIPCLGLALAALGLSGTAQNTGTTTAPATFPTLATADSNDAMIAVTGIDVTGSSILFLIDTESRHLAVYQATGGSSSTMNVRLVGARNIDLDLQLDGYNDKSEHSYKRLMKEFDKSSRAAASGRAGGGE